MIDITPIFADTSAVKIRRDKLNINDKHTQP